MHGHEKSDPAMVAVKPANKAEPAVEQSTAEHTAAEPEEPRAGTKGNADQQSTCRTQRRVSVSQALERIRKVARERKKERFAALPEQRGEIEQLRREIARVLVKGEGSIEHLAKATGTSVRTLQRRLNDAGVRYSDLQNDVRKAGLPAR